MTAHIPLPPTLRLEPAFRHVQEFLNRHDPGLRLRKSAERAGVYILERRCRRRPATNAGMFDTSDMHVQARDGYIHVASVHWQWLTRPWNIVRALKDEGADLWARGGRRLHDELTYEEDWVKETRHRRRFGLLRDIAVDAFDPLSRMGNKDGTERTRISAPGWPSQLEASDTASISRHQGASPAPHRVVGEHAAQPQGAS